MIANHFPTSEIGLILSPSRKWGALRKAEEHKQLKVLVCWGGQTCIPAAVQQLQLTSIRPPLASLPNRFLLSRHATPTNYGRLTLNRLDCDPKLWFIFTLNLCMCVCVCVCVGGGCSRSILITRSASVMPTGCLYLLCVWFKVAHFSWPSILTPHICLLSLYISQVSFSL